MDVLKPELIWVDGRCYRKLPIKTKFIETARNHVEEETEEAVPPPPGFEQVQNNFKQCTTEEPCDADDSENVQIDETSRGLQIKLNVAKSYFRFIIGRGGETKRRLESETKCTLHVPGFQEKGPIVINGQNKQGVLSCRRKILNLVDFARQQQQPTHFLSIPFNSTQIQNSYNEFKEKVLKQCRNSRGLDESIFIEPTKLHLTIAMMVLMDDSERDEAKSLLPLCYQQVITPFLNSQPDLSYELNGLEYMNDDPSEVDVLYAKICSIGNKNPSKLQALVNQVCEFYASKNLVVRNRESVKMHVTLMNTRYRRKDEVDSRRARESFDARLILEKFKNYYFGVEKFSCLHISQRHAESEDGYYFSTGRVDF